MQGSKQNLSLQRAFDLILEEFRERILPEVFEVHGSKPKWQDIPIENRCTMFIRYLKHLEHKKVITSIQAGALELKYLEDVFTLKQCEAIKD